MDWNYETNAYEIFMIAFVASIWTKVVLLNGGWRRGK